MYIYAYVFEDDGDDGYGYYYFEDIGMLYFFFQIRKLNKTLLGMLYICIPLYTERMLHNSIYTIT